MIFEQYSHEPYIVVTRVTCGWTPTDSPRRVGLPKLRERGHAAQALIDQSA
jgi:glutathione S-transferase